MAAAPESNYLFKLFEDTKFKAKMVVPYDDFLYHNPKQLDQLLSIHARRGKMVLIDKTCEHLHNEQQAIELKNKLNEHGLLDRAIVLDNTDDETYFKRHGIRHLYIEGYIWFYLSTTERRNPRIKNKTHKFLCMNNFSKEHRWGIISALHNHMLIDDVLWSYRDSGKKFPNNKFAHYDFQRPTYIDQPLEAEGNVGSQAQNFNQNLNLEGIYNRTDYTIVNETDFDEPHLTSCTEKSYLSLFYETFPIIVSVPGTVQVLKAQGFDVFDDVVDHAYDQELDHKKRFDMIINEIKRLKNESPEVNENRHKFNRSHMTNTTYWHKHINNKLKSYQFS